MTSLSGLGPGVGDVVRGRVVFADATASNIREGDVLVTDMTSNDMLAGMARALAVVTNTGGIVCHAAIVCNEMGKPFVVGTRAITSLKDGDMVEIDPVAGKVTVLVAEGV